MHKHSKNSPHVEGEKASAPEQGSSGVVGQGVRFSRELIAEYYDSFWVWVRNRPSAIFFFSCLFVLSVVLAGRPVFQVNDDLGILDDIRMGLEVRFMSVLLGNVLSFFYVHVHEGVPWYGITLFSLMTASLAFGLYALFQLERLKTLLPAFVLIYLLSFIFFLISIGYNSVSIIAGGHALFAFFVYLRNPNTRGGVVVSLGLLFACSFLMRMRGLQGVVVFSLPVVLWTLAAYWRKKAVYIGLFALPLITCMGINTVLMNRPSAETPIDFEEFNHVRGRFHDFPISFLNWNNPGILEANNWSPNDYRMLLRYMHLDENKFNTSTLENIFTHSVPLPARFGPLHPGRVLSAATWLYGNYTVYFWMLAAVLIMALSTMSGRDVLCSLLYAVYACFGMAAMIYFYRFPMRIGLPLFLTVHLMMVCVMYCRPLSKTLSPGREKWQRGMRWAAGVGCLLVGLELYAELSNRVRTYKMRIAMYEKDLEDLNRLCKGHAVLFQPGQGLQRQFGHPLREPALEFTRIPVGWAIYSPRFYKTLSGLGLRHGCELLPWMVDHPQARAVFREYDIPYLLHFIFETYKIDCVAYRIARLESGSTLYQLQLAPEQKGNG